MLLTRPNSAIADLVESSYRKRRSFVAGFTLTNRKEVLLYDVDGNYYEWRGALPKVVPKNATPASTGGISLTAWQSVGKADDIAIINAKFVAIEQEIDQLRTEIPESGKSAYQVAVDNGFVGTETEWLASLKGDTGAPLNMKGSLASTAQLPPTGNVAGDAYIVGEDMYAWDGKVWKKVNGQGPQGKSAYEVWLAAGNTGTIYDYLADIKGAKGDPGPQGAKGEPGVNANGFDYQGSVTNIGDLPPPSPNNVSQAWSINTYLYVSNGTSWINMGPIVGPQGIQGIQGEPGEDGADGKDGTNGTDGADGKSAYQIWLDEGNFGTEDDFIEAITGPQGVQGIQGPQGPIGTQGPVGEGLDIVDELEDPSELPATGRVGQAYLIDNELWVWLTDATTYTNVGQLTGTSITAKGSIPDAGDLPVYADYGDAYLTADSGNLYIYTLDYTTSTADWVDMGSLKGPKGDKGENGQDGVSGIPEAPNDAKLYGRKSQAWAEVVIPVVDGGTISPTAINTGTVTADYLQLNSTNASVTGTWTPPGNRNMSVLTVTGNVTIAAWPGVTGSTKPKPFSAVIYLIQDATGHTVTLDSSYYKLNATDISIVPNGVTILQLTYCGVGAIVDAVVVTR